MGLALCRPCAQFQHTQKFRCNFPYYYCYGCVEIKASKLLHIPKVNEMFQIWNISLRGANKLDKSKCSRSNPDFANIVEV